MTMTTNDDRTQFAIKKNLRARNSIRVRNDHLGVDARRPPGQKQVVVSTETRRRSRCGARASRGSRSSSFSHAAIDYVWFRVTTSPTWDASPATARALSLPARRRDSVDRSRRSGRGLRRRRARTVRSFECSETVGSGTTETCPSRGDRRATEARARDIRAGARATARGTVSRSARRGTRRDLWSRIRDARRRARAAPLRSACDAAVTRGGARLIEVRQSPDGTQWRAR